MTRRLLSYLNDADTAEALAYGFGVPPEPALTEVRSAWWRLRRQGLRLPAERQVILVAGISLPRTAGAFRHPRDHARLNRMKG